jgi:hypothetical protein
MRQKSQLVLPCDPEYTAHREARKRRQETREWLLRRERTNTATSIVPDVRKRNRGKNASATIRTHAVDWC